MIPPQFRTIAEEHAGFLHHGDAMLRRIPAKGRNLPLLGRKHAGKQFEGGGFSRAVGARIGAQIPLFQRKAHPIQGVNPVRFPAEQPHRPLLIVIFHNVFHFNYRIHGKTSPQFRKPMSR